MRKSNLLLKRFDLEDIENAKKEYDHKGLVIFKNISSDYAIEKVFRTINFLYKKYSPEKQLISDSEDLWNVPLFHNKLIELRNETPELFASIYDDCQQSSSLHELMHEQKILTLAAKIFGDEESSTLALSGTMLRLDVPNDSRNVYTWHQDHSYYKQNESGMNGMVAVIALHDLEEQYGTLRFRINSHKEGLVKAEAKDRVNHMESSQYVVSEEILNKFTVVNLVIKKGDLALFSMDTIHASGVNISKKIRLTSILRIHRMLEEDFNSFRDESIFIKDVKREFSKSKYYKKSD